jgi:hypothetical protein
MFCSLIGKSWGNQLKENTDIVNRYCRTNKIFIDRMNNQNIYRADVLMKLFVSPSDATVLMDIETFTKNVYGCVPEETETHSAISIILKHLANHSYANHLIMRLGDDNITFTLFCADRKHEFVLEEQNYVNLYNKLRGSDAEITMTIPHVKSFINIIKNDHLERAVSCHFARRFLDDLSVGGMKKGWVDITIDSNNELTAIVKPVSDELDDFEVSYFLGDIDFFKLMRHGRAIQPRR